MKQETCTGCFALTNATNTYECLLGYSVDPKTPTPLEECPKPLTLRMLFKEAAKQEKNHE